MKYLLAFDDRCGPCTRFRNVIGFLDPHHKLDYCGLNVAERSGRLDPVPPSRRHRSFHLVSPDGRVWSGPPALSPLTALLPFGKGLSAAMEFPPVSSAAAFAYVVFLRLHDSGACTRSRGDGTKTGPGPRLGIDLDIDVDHPPNAFGLRF